MSELKTALIILLGGLAALFILTLAGRVARKVFSKPLWFLRFFLPFFITEAWRFTHHDKTRWKKIALLNVAVLASIAGIIVSYKLAGAFNWPGHNFYGYQISWLGFQTYFVYCAHGHHNAILWLIRIVLVITTMNMFTALFMSWEDCGRELLGAFIANKFLERGAGKIELIAPFTYLLKSRAPFHFLNIIKMEDALQRSSSITWLGIGNAPPSGLMIMASRNGLPSKNIRLYDLPKAESLTKVCIGLSPIPIWIDLREKPQTGVVGPTGAGKSTLGRTIAAQLNLANPDIVNIFIDIRGVDYADVSRAFNPNIDRAGLTWQQYRSQCKPLRNVIVVRDLDTLQRVMQLVDDEVTKRERFLIQNGLTNVSDAADSQFWTPATKVTRILIFWDGFSIAFRRYEKDARFQKAVNHFFTATTDGRKYGIHAIVLTTRASFNMLEEARDEYNWFACGDFRARTGEMVFETKLSGLNRRGTFMYSLPAPYVGYGLGLGADTPLTLREDSLAGALTRSSARASEACLKLGDWFNINLHRVQHDEELEKAHEAVEKYLASPR